MVKSCEENHKRPYFVECKATTGQVICEKGCPLYSSCKVCAHTVAVARHTGTMDEYVKWLQKQKGSLNVTSLADLNMPKGAGKKPHRKASQKSSMKQVKRILAKEHPEMTPRVQPQPTTTDEMGTCTSQLNETQVFHPDYDTDEADIPGPSSPPHTSPVRYGFEHDHCQPQAVRMPPPLVSVGPLMSNVTMSICSTTASPVYSPVLNIQTHPDTRDIFWLQFVKGNILRCNGCGKRNLRGEDGKPMPPPHDLCVQHRVCNPHTGKYQMSKDLRNVYYHVAVTCIKQKNPDFLCLILAIFQDDIKSKLNGIHLSYLLDCLF